MLIFGVSPSVPAIVVNCPLRLAGPFITRAIAAAARFVSTTGWRIASSIIGCIKTRPLEDHTATGANQALNFTSAGRTFCDGFVFHALKFFKRMATVFALVFVCRHYRDLVSLDFRLKRLLHLKWSNFDLAGPCHLAPILRFNYLFYLLHNTQCF